MPTNGHQVQGDPPQRLDDPQAQPLPSTEELAAADERREAQTD